MIEQIKAALYVRLSQEDRNKLHPEDNSESINNQIMLLKSRCEKEGWIIYDIYNDDDFSGSFNIVKPGVYDRKPDHGEHPDSYASVKKRSRRACGHDLRESRYAGCACCNEKISAYAFRRNASASDDRDGTLL